MVLKVYTFNLSEARWLSWLERRPVTAEVVPPLATREPIQKADDRTRTDNLLITNQLLCQLSHIRAHNPKVVGSNPAPAIRLVDKAKQLEISCFYILIISSFII